MYIHRIAESKIKNLLISPKVIILLGARQVGKTTLIQRIIRHNKGLVLNLDIEVDKARLLGISHLAPKDAIRSLGNPSLFIIDEAQRLPEAGRIVKGWFDSKIKTKIVLLGSSSLNLLSRSAESLTGRNVKLFLPPLLFSEVLSPQPWYSEKLTSDILKQDFHNQLDALIQEQMIYGSYPETVVTSQKQQYLLNLVSDYLLKDVFQSTLINSPDTVKKLLLLLAHQIGSEVSLTELANNLQISRVTVEKYLDLLERSFVIFRLPAFSNNLRKEIVKSHKIFFWDTGVRNAILKDFNFSGFRNDFGLLWENWVIAELAKKDLLEGQLNNFYFWRTMNGSEVDLIIKGSSTFKAYEIKWSKERQICKAFTNRYHVPVKTISKNNVIDFIL
ncbi:ATPase [Candidatus Roizmanbacteria bacterium CG10_big_fil_rev_8_21_14_0_10_36_26]|uniref:ATPase n=1 Tax=Candidatus Roizmanbacteria bacterium CG10_big_fil_rev_8_21_14_0_10_36_26 TaxID=1974851 RepID=A0A2M8KMV2_9BACT|nr:MAG: ATPase [Candidatus Roizmanbacteria bacterium CG10_big_fil_rev_8_21_14_0_10_36_26]